MPTEGILDDVVRLFAQTTTPMLLEVVPVALGLAGVLFALQLAWDGAMWVLFDTEDMFAKAVRKGTIFLVLYGLLSVTPLWLPQIFEGFEALARRLTGLQGLSPSAILGQGLDLGFTFFTSWSRFLTGVLPGISALRHLSMFFVIAAFALVAFQLARVLVEISLALGGLVVFLAFWAHRLSFGLAEGYLRYVLELGIRAYVLFLIVAVGRDLGRQWDQALRGFGLLDLRLHFAILAGAALFALLAWQLPKEIASRVAGGLNLSGHNPLRDSHG